MDTYQKLETLKTILDPVEDDESTLLSYLSQAKDVILNRLYPYLEDDMYDTMDVPRKYHSKQVRIAAYLLNKRGAEGETQHSENGINRSYKSADVPEDMLWDVLPMVGIPR